MGVLDELGIREEEVVALARDERTPPRRERVDAGPSDARKVVKGYDVVVGAPVVRESTLGPGDALSEDWRLDEQRYHPDEVGSLSEAARPAHRRRRPAPPEAWREALRADESEIDALTEEWAYASASERGWGG